MKRLGFIIIFFYILTLKSFIQDINVKYDSKGSLGYNETVPIGFEITTRDGSIIRTKGFLNGSLPWRKLKIKVTGGKLKKGLLHIKSGNKLIDSCLVRFEVKYKRERIKKTVFLELLFNTTEFLNYKPEAAANGGVEANWKSLFLAGDGGDGDNGKDGPYIIIDLKTIVINEKKILKIVVKKDKEIHKYFINPDLGKITILAEGGDGGAGGNGGGIVSKQDSDDRGEYGGNGGNGGYGGIIDIIVNEETVKYIHCINIQNDGGSGGCRGFGKYSGKDGLNGFKGKINIIKK